MYSRTREEVEEEEYLIEELRKIEIRRKEREKKQQVCVTNLVNINIQNENTKLLIFAHRVY